MSAYRAPCLSALLTDLQCQIVHGSSGLTIPASDKQSSSVSYAALRQQISVAAHDSYTMFLLQLREQAAWFWSAPKGGPSADEIRAWMGELGSIRCIARYSARMGQCFSNTYDTLRMEVRLRTLQRPGHMPFAVTNRPAVPLVPVLLKEVAPREPQ